MGKLNKCNYVNQAENVIKKLQYKDKRGKLKIDITNSKIRNLLSYSNNLYNSLIRYNDKELNENLISTIQYIKMKFAYEAGREHAVKNFVQKAEIMETIENIGTSKDNALLFCRYMEALVAYHKFYGGRDR